MQDGKKSLQQSLAGMKVHAVAELHSWEVALQVLGSYTSVRMCCAKMQPKPPKLILFISEGGALVDEYT